MKRCEPDIGVMLVADTNVLVRLLVSDDRRQQRAVRRRLEHMLNAGEQLFVETVVLAELSWVLDSAYGFGRIAIAEAIAALVDTPPLFCPRKSAVVRALDWYRAGPADFSDYLIVSLGHERDCRVLTFDKKLLKHERCETP